jgi:hypothetical protein
MSGRNNYITEMAFSNRMSFLAGLRWLTLSLALIIQCLSRLIIFSLLHPAQEVFACPRGYADHRLQTIQARLNVPENF